MGTVRTTSVASLDTSSCRTSVCWQDLPSCCSLLSSRTKSFLTLAFSLGGDWHEFFWGVKEGELHASILLTLAFACFVRNLYNLCLTCNSSHDPGLCLHSDQLMHILWCTQWCLHSLLPPSLLCQLQSVRSLWSSKKKTKKRVETLIQHFVSSVPVNS